MTIAAAARRLAATLQQREMRVVFAESCTAGLVSASLASVPGVSDWHCGSFATYRNESKIGWLHVSAASIRKHTAVSEPVAKQMALGALRATEEACVAGSITGHFGPNAPEGFDGVVFIGLAERRGKRRQLVGVHRHQLTSDTRSKRQREATELLLDEVNAIL